MCKHCEKNKAQSIDKKTFFVQRPMSEHSCSSKTKRLVLESNIFLV